MVVTPSTAARNGRFVETLGTYDPVRKPAHVEIDEERALHWLLNGAKPTETTAYLLNRIGVLDRFFEQRPGAKKEYSFLDKRTAAMSVKSAIEPEAKKEAPAPEPAAEPVAPEAPAAPEAQAAPTEETESVEETAAEAPAETAEAAVSEPETPAETEEKPE